MKNCGWREALVVEKERRVFLFGLDFVLLRVFVIDSILDYS